MNQFFSTELASCPYLLDRLERRLVVPLADDVSEGEHDRLIRAGFRRSQSMAYRPVCPGCSACVPIRIPAADFRFNRGWRRVLRANADLLASEHPAKALDEHYQLFRRYLASRHADGGMAGMGWSDYRSMIEDGPPSAGLIEWRYGDGRLAGVSLTDRVTSGLSGVYKFFDPEAAKRSLGSMIILWHVQRARALGLAYVYLGYWIAGSPKMAYKARFRPLEQLTVRGWQPLAEAD
jgi:arginine-tRNA-protein transferase